MKHLLRSSIASFSLLGALLCGSQEAQAQFSTPTIDGFVEGTAEYSGNNYSSNEAIGTSPVWHITWDANNVYFAVTNTNPRAGTVVYIDSDPLPIVNGGTKANGNLKAFFNYDGVAGDLPFRADRAIYFKDGYQERRIASADPAVNSDRNEGGWVLAEKSLPENNGTDRPVGPYASKNDNGSHEIAIPWTKINKDGSAGPKVFNWFGFVTSTASGNASSGVYGTGYGSVPFGNPLSGGPSTSNSSPQFIRYFTEHNVTDRNVNNTGSGTGGAAFFQNVSYTQIGNSTTNFKDISVYDFTLNTPGATINRADNNNGQSLDWNITHNLSVQAGTLYLGGSTDKVTVGNNIRVYEAGGIRAGNAQITVSGNFDIQGSFDPDGERSSLTLDVGGDSINVPDNSFSLNTLSLIRGTKRVLSNNLQIKLLLSIIDGSVLTTGVSQNTNRSNSVTLAGGNNNITGKLDERTGGYLVGSISATNFVSSVTTYSFGGIGFTLANQRATQPNPVTVRRITGKYYQTVVDNKPGVSRQYEVTSSIDPSISVDLQFTYYNGKNQLPDELNGNDENMLAFFKAPLSSGPNGPYDRITSSTSVPDPNNKPFPRVRIGGLTNLNGYYTLGTGDRPLPVELASFSGQYANNSVLLKWTTASEKNNKGFGVERRVGEGSNWQQLAFVAGKSATGAAYSYVDATAPQGTSYYRLRQEDNDGTTAYSPVVAVLVAGQASGTLALSPVPTTDQLTISGFGDGKHVAEVYNLRGQRVLTQEISNAQATLSVSTLPSGVYLVRVQGTGSAQKGKFVKL